MPEARDAGYCAAGQRRFLRENYPDEWREWCLRGIPVARCAEVNAALTVQVLKLREARRGKEA
jgi:hypothetical protein